MAMSLACHHRAHGGERFPASLGLVNMIGRVVGHPSSSAHAFLRGFGLDSAAVCLCHLSSHWDHVRHQPRCRAGRRARWSMHATPTWACTSRGQGTCSEWTVDDGQVFVRPWSCDSWLRALDVASFGATRGCVAHGIVKNSACLLCPPERILEFVGGGTRRTSTTLSPSSARTRGPQHLGPPSALASTSTRVSGSRCVLATRCAPRSLVLITPPRRWR